MDGEEAVIVAGVGFRQGVAAGEIVETIERALAKAALGRRQLTRLATVASRASEPGLLDAARCLDLAIEAIAPDRLAEAEPRVQTRSERITELHGVGSVAEAAALCAAGQASRLLVARISNGRATCAIAEGRDS